MADFPRSELPLGNSLITPGHIWSIGDQLDGENAQFTQTATAWPVANTAIYFPIYIQRTVTIYKVAVMNEVTLNGAFDIGVFDSAGNKLMSTGSQTQTGASTVQVVDTTDLVLNPNYYWVGMATNSSTATYLSATPPPRVLRVMGVQEQTTAFTLPSSMTATTMGRTYLPWVGLVTNPNAVF